ncbi:MAG: type III pantothenate kinase [Clostridiales bacterium]|nr:type III pantothenate kinase [Clostridiales bacterium]
MILVADMGNTNIKLGVYDCDRLMATARLKTKVTKTPDEFEQDVISILCKNKINAEDIKAIAISTVVPETTKVFLEGVRKLIPVKPLIVGNDTKTGIKISTDVPAELGIDRLVNAAAAFHDYGGPLLVIDFGTATTYDVITEKGEFLGGVIAPGIRSCAEALWEKTAKLPKIAIEKPDKVMGTNTVSSMKAGIFYSCLGQLEYFVRHLKKELGIDFKVIATGGLSDLFVGNTNVMDIFDSNLTLKGLNYISMINNH